MTRCAFLAALCLGLPMLPPATSACASEAAPGQVGETSRRSGDAYNRFGFRLFDQISGQDFGKNIFISPASAAFALAMLYNGAEGATRAEMTDVLEFGGLSLEEVNEANSLLLESLNEGDSSVDLAVANSIWCRSSFQFRQDFLDRTKRFYTAEIAALNFDDPRTTDVINGWVKESTREKIKSIIDRIDPLDVMFIINAVYFKGMWTHPFAKSQTADRAFHLLDGTTADVPMMQQERGFGYLANEAFQAIRLPYGDGSYCMYVFLPAAEYGLERFVADVGPENWARWRDAFGSQDVNLVMPRFKLEYDRSFNDALQAMGMKSAFDAQTADLTGMWEPSDVKSPNLYVSFVRQKTYVDVNEEGTEAAAVTGIGIATASMPPPPIEMIVDRPFFCAIVDDTTGLILFMGAIVDPAGD